MRNESGRGPALFLCPFCRRHVSHFFSLTVEERAGLWWLMAQLRERVFREYGPDGINVGMNVGNAAEPIVAHARVHAIPRSA